jgi:hypothetical protein
VSRASNSSLNDLASTKSIGYENESRHTLIVGRHVDADGVTRTRQKKPRSSTVDNQCDSSSLSSFDGEPTEQQQYLSNSQLLSAEHIYIRPWLVRRATAPDIHCLDNDIGDTRVENSPTDVDVTLFALFPTRDDLDIYTRFTCLITILFYLRDIADEYSNGIIYDHIEHIEAELRRQHPSVTPTTTTTSAAAAATTTHHANVFQTINSDGTKRYRTGVLLDVNGSSSARSINISSKQIEWKRVKLVVRRFRKKYQRYRQLMKNDTKVDLHHSTIDSYLKYFDSTSARRMRKYARHYAEKI